MLTLFPSSPGHDAIFFASSYMHDNCLFKLAISHEELVEQGTEKRQRLNSGNELSKWKRPLVPNYLPL
jgi:hypothetical protein